MSNSIKKGYKVVFEYDGELYSFNKHYECVEKYNTILEIFTADLYSVVKYKINEWTKHKKDCGALAVFSDIDNAIKFCNQHSHVGMRIYSCLYCESKERSLYNPISIKYDEFRLPKNTCFACKVKLLEEVI